MTKSNIAQLGEPVLREIAQPIDDVIRPDIQRLAQTMLLILEDSTGVGLAAPQIFESKRIIIVASKPTKRYPYAPEMSATVMINPEFIQLSNEVQKDWEGCLSIPGIRALVPRYKFIQVTYTDLIGQRLKVDLEGFVARVFQHEFDHLNGLVYLDRVESNQDIVSEQLYLKLIADIK
ncbi:MAG: peptide deformylase [Methylococcaceae bacterium]|nr:peptide deformylase [Methylococcaceae bacterium]